LRKMLPFVPTVRVALICMMVQMLACLMISLLPTSRVVLLYMRVQMQMWLPTSRVVLHNHVDVTEVLGLDLDDLCVRVALLEGAARKEAEECATDCLQLQIQSLPTRLDAAVEAFTKTQTLAAEITARKTVEAVTPGAERLLRVEKAPATAETKAKKEAEEKTTTDADAKEKAWAEAYELLVQAEAVAKEDEAKAKTEAKAKKKKIVRRTGAGRRWNASLKVVNAAAKAYLSSAKAKQDEKLHDGAARAQCSFVVGAGTEKGTSMSGAPMESKGLDKVPGDMDSGVAEPLLGRAISAKQARAALLSLAGSEKQRLHIATMELPDELDLMTLQEKAKAISLPVRK
ncbi:unnamed protein product, partial [Prorocentrum cordatum]